MPDADPNRSQLREPNTAAGFLLAPGIASLIGAAIVAGAILLGPAQVGVATRFGTAVMGGLIMSMAFALVGYLTAAIVGVPVYLVLPARARGCFAVVVPLAGAVAAAPWLPVVAPWRHGSADLSLLAIPFGLGVVAGIAFLFLRRSPVMQSSGPASAGEGASPS